MPRYIDADEVLETMRSNMDMQELYLPTHFIDLVIENIPSADVQPVKRGRWVYSDIPIFGNPYADIVVLYVVQQWIVEKIITALVAVQI